MFSDVAENVAKRSHILGSGENKDVSKIDVENSRIMNQGTGTDNKNEMAVMSRMALNTNKAGMEGLDKGRINQIILEASKGSRFYENEQKKESETDQRVATMKQQLDLITEKDKQKAVQVMDALAQQLEVARDLSRTIVHLDMDAFYAAVEMRDNPSLNNKPMAVGSMSMLCTSNYLARRFGVRAAMPGFIAKKLCPDLILIPTNFDKYREASKQVREILKEYDPNFCPMSLDEAYFDLTEHLVKRKSLTDKQRTFYNPYHCAKTKCDIKDEVKGMNHRDVNSSKGVERLDDERNVEGEEDISKCVTFGFTDEDAVNEIRFRIQAKTQLTASAGIAPNTMLAKVCSDKNKPNGQYKIQPTREAVMDFVRTLPIRKVGGIGKVTEKMLKSLNIETCSDMFVHRGILHLLFSEISSHHFLQTSLGLGSTRVERSSERKSISVERTFRELSTPSDLYLKLNELCQSLSKDLKEEEIMGKTVSIKLKNDKFQVKTRSSSVSHAIDSLEAIYASASELLRLEIIACHPDPLKLRLMGVRMSSLISANVVHSKQGTLMNFFQKPKTTSSKLVNGPEMHDHKETLKSSNITNSNDMSNNMTLNYNMSNIAQDKNRTMSEEVTESHEINNHLSDIPHTRYMDSIPEAATIEGRLFEFVCPICNNVQMHNDLNEFNKHVDLCLNDKEIKSILSEQDQEVNKQPISPVQSSKRNCGSETSSAKRRKNDDKGTIKYFFQNNNYGTFPSHK
ncbi:DNA polymerase kappa-like isoform X2 [Antedon mediterranea]|uniref:DNA polymerase kappa-like isoform X2 n=1 Tax=Antedon mediterranea TaxID=105859 RepID=UPI003AF93942